ncbi:MAG: polyprenyl diphosphate synthase [Gemmatimonadetes bacterium]|nr:polyprenyl diphosphate synthase [Gemmatimonadota bacterium]
MAARDEGVTGLHVAVIMDGNGRWAVERGLPRAAGHRAGARAVRRVVAAAPGMGIDTLTLYAVSSDNMQRPARELAMLFGVIREYLEELARSGPDGPQVRVIGRRDRLPAAVVAAEEAAELATADSSGLRLRLAIDYGARDSIVRAVRLAAQRSGEAGVTAESFAQLLDPGAGRGAPDVDLLIRTGGEKRLSDFLLWESAYAELYFTDVLWPGFGAADLAAALTAFRARDRRFGRIREPVAT